MLNASSLKYLLILNIFLELDEQPANGDDDDDDDDNPEYNPEDDDPDDDESDAGVENPVGQITLTNGNRIDRGSAGALRKSRNDHETEDQVKES
jgi:hypothetical protein